MDRLLKEVLDAAALRPTETDPAEAEGFAAYEDGAWEDLDNPYQPGTFAYSAWLDGWDRAYHHYTREREMDERDANELRKYR